MLKEILLDTGFFQLIKTTFKIIGGEMFFFLTLWWKKGHLKCFLFVFYSENKGIFLSFIHMTLLYIEIDIIVLETMQGAF